MERETTSVYSSNGKQGTSIYDWSLVYAYSDECKDRKSEVLSLNVAWTLNSSSKLLRLSPG